MSRANDCCMHRTYVCVYTICPDCDAPQCRARSASLSSSSSSSSASKKRQLILPEAVVKYILNFCPWYWFEGADAQAKEKSRSRLGSLLGGLSRRLSETKEQIKSAQGGCQIS
uniref:Uncharacterized protein n=1 Tax=Lotharella oceanica TaxID=641309 RepID=A0A7S2TUU3_9EUKA|mmetsp:Transcript_3077/g.5962  ORF Transcript_3077/g.5962 Transcript_3077/m.5962 type:complete len:113 (+) Transcript_3077:106-444(+)